MLGADLKKEVTFKSFRRVFAPEIFDKSAIFTAFLVFLYYFISIFISVFIN